MTTSCLDRTLISNAVAGTGANVSLLIQALSPLCPKPPPPIEAFANSLSIVVVGYVCGFLPWGFLALVDFISAKWKTVRATRRAGLLHLAGSVFPMIFVVAYAVIQGLSGDYKEMMTAVIAVVLTMYHMGRTAWGLAQLREYVKWCNYALQCIHATLPESNVNDEEETDLDGELMVNSDIVDNEFSGRDISVSLSWRNWSMEVSNPKVCTVRWSAAFLCSLGHKWKSSKSKPFSKIVELFLSISFLFLDDEHIKMRPTSFWELSQVLFSKGSNCGAFGGCISKFLAQGWEPFKANTFEFQNIVSSYPACNESDELFEDVIEQNRLDARVEMVEYILASRILGPSMLRSITSYSEMLHERFLCSEQARQAFDLLQEQIGVAKEETVSYWDLHSFWKLTTVPVCSAIPNAFLSSLPMIALIILSYPAIRIEYMEEDQPPVDAVQGSDKYRIVPMLAPQKLYLSLSVDGSTGDSSLRIVAEGDNTTFDWEKWINTALAIMKSHNEAFKSKQSEGSNGSIGPLELIKKVDLSRPMLTLTPSKDDAVLSDLPGDLHLWTAWPIFDVRFSQFELDQWMVACGPLIADEFRRTDSIYDKRKSTAMKTLKKIATWDRT